MQRVILASGSPRRRELLTQIGIEHEVLVSDAPEVTNAEKPAEIVMDLSLQKGRAVTELLQPAADEETVFVVAADTVVAIDGKILGKPVDAADAARMLRELSGRAHSVFTGVSILKKDASSQWTVRQFYHETAVHVMPLTEEEIEWYIGTGDPFDKAGAYGIQNGFAAFIDRVEGDYQNVVGLPVCDVYQALKDMGWRRDR